MSHLPASAITGVRILGVFSDNSMGVGTLTVASTDTVTWTPPSSTVGSAATLVSGGLALVAGSGGVGKILVKRTTSDDLDSTESATVFCTGEKCTIEELGDINDAVAAAKQAQAGGVGDERIERARLETLLKEQARIRARYEREVGLLPAGPAYFDMSGT